MEGTYELNRYPHQTVVETKSTIADKINTKEEKKSGYLEKSKGPFPGFRKNLYNYFLEYSNYTSIQGIRYIGEQQRPIFERLSWLVFFCISLYFCISLISQAYIKWDTSPVLVSFARSPTPTWKIPFPAVTICAETKARQTLYNYTENYHRITNDPANMTKEEKETFSNVALLCGDKSFPGDNKTIDIGTVDFLLNLAPQSDEILWSCQYIYTNVTCQELFTPILTDDGLCFTFNMLDRTEVYRDNVFLYRDYMSHGTKSEEWTLGDGYSINASIDTYPKRGLSVGSESGFSIVLRAYEKDIDYVCRGPVQGYKIGLHNPAETPRIIENYFRAAFKQELTVSVNPTMVTTSDGLKNYKPHRRHCYFPDEKYLSFYQSYTQQNCEIECLANFTNKHCGCVTPDMPHEVKTPICGPASASCMVEARKGLLRQEVESKLETEKSGSQDTSLCDCLPGCTSLVYNAETSQADFDLEKYVRSYRKNDSEFKGMLLTRINIFFKEQQFITSERNELYGQTDFLANCGGLLGLFTGFSFLSLVEIIYFLSLRLFCNVRKFGRHYWSGSQDLVNSD